MKKIINMHLHRYRKTGGDVCNSQRFKIGYTMCTMHSKYRDEKVLLESHRYLKLKFNH